IDKENVLVKDNQFGANSDIGTDYLSLTNNKKLNVDSSVAAVSTSKADTSFAIDEIFESILNGVNEQLDPFAYEADSEELADLEGMNMPPIQAVKKFQKSLQETHLEVLPKMSTSIFGNEYHTILTSSIIALEMANPQVNREMHHFAKDIGTFVKEFWQSGKWRGDLQQPIAGFGYNGAKQIVGAIYNEVKNYLSSADREIVNKPHRLHEIANGRPVKTVVLSLGSNDASGNKSKKWNAHYSWVMSIALLPYKLRHLDYYVHFLSTSN
ncbi:hypothetical protein HK098_007789, partial [Nowakowskiella sp. JEL0407]